MIWLDKEEEFWGCVPVLKKNYTETQIREMSKHSAYIGWSNLSSLVMRIQGINEDFNGGFMHHYVCKAPKKLIDVDFSFSFECFYNSDAENIQYIKQIVDVFEHLTLYVVEKRSKKQMHNTVAVALRNIQGFVSSRTFDSVKYDINHFFEGTKKTVDNLDKLLVLFDKFSLGLTHDLIVEPNEEIIKMVNEERNVEQTYYMECLPI